MGTRTAVSVETTNGTGGSSTAIREAIEKSIPAIVHIEAIWQREITNQAPCPWVKNFLNPGKKPLRFRDVLKKAGTGVIIDSRGHVLTSRHVVAGATKIRVSLINGRQYPARIVGTDLETETAVLRVLAAEKLPSVSFGNSDEVEVGEYVAAVVHLRPEHLSVTHGTIRGKRAGGTTGPVGHDDYLEKDAVINLDNSGGPLFNLRGEVIGVNVAILSSRGKLKTIAFSVPSNVALHVAKQLISRRKVNRKLLGPSQQCLCLVSSLIRSADIRDFRGNPGYGSRPRKPAIKKKDAASSPNKSDLQAAGVVDKETRTSNHRNVGEAGEESLDSSVRAEINVQAISIKRRLGLVTRPPTPRETRAYRLGAPQILVISWLDPIGPLGRAGVEVNDMMLEINGQPIEGFDHLVDLVSGFRPRERITIRVLDHRSGRTGYIQVPVY